MTSRQPKKFTPTQPRTYKVSFKSILSFPARLCKPPPAVGKVRSCTVTPLYNVRLDDVLDRNHLPPLGLKDFEEWLLFVEMSPENLYFILWLRDYKQRYNQWKSQSAFQSRNAPSDYPLNWSSQHSSQLAMFYARAKQTFFTPGSEYELNLTSSLLAPFHQPNMSPHPDPSLFREVKLETYRTLDASLRRFVHAQFNNVGNKRILCGIVAGIIFTLAGFIPPLVLNFLHGGSRWSRLAALPGLWIGITVLLTSLNGICLGIYIFGDLRQLRKFELSRPPISKPQPLPPFKGHPQPARPVSITNSILPIQQPRTQTASNPVSGGDRPRASSIASDQVSEGSSLTVSTDDRIHISPAYYDADDIDGLATCSLYHTDQEKQENEEKCGASPPDSFMATAGFIRPFEPMSDDEDDLERSLDLPQRHQLITPFDFDSLPSRPNLKTSSNDKPIYATPKQLNLLPIQTPRPPEPAAPSGLLGRMQNKCSIAPWRLQTGYLEPATPTTLGPGSPQAPHPSSPYWLAHPNHSTTSATATARTADTEAKVRKGFRSILAVPAFAVPLTRVLSPVIVRGQWEIVIRCTAAAFLLAWTIVGSLLAIPPVARR